MHARHQVIDMRTSVNTVLRRYAAPYARHPWWVLATEGVASIVAGMIVATVLHPGAIGLFVIAFAMLLAGIDQILVGARPPREAASAWKVLRGGISLSAAAPALLSPWVAAIPAAGARSLLALALIACGVAEIGLLAVTHHGQEVRAGAGAFFNFAVLPIVVGILLLTTIPPEVVGALWNSGTWGAVWIFTGLTLLVGAAIRWHRTHLMG